MRTLSTTLTTAQEAITNTSYIYLNINSTDYSSRLLSLEHVEEPYREQAIIVLDNHDRALDIDTVDLRGKQFYIGYGYVTTSGNEYLGDGTNTAMPNLWVKTQHTTSVEGKVVCVLTATGYWGKLRDIPYITVGTADEYYYHKFGGTQTIKEIIELALTDAGLTLNATFGDDGIINTFKPFFVTNILSFPNLASLIENDAGTGMLQKTKCYLRSEATNVMKLIYPQTTDDINETYFSDHIPYFREYTEKANLTLPNSILVFWGADEDGTWTSTTAKANLLDPGTATDATSIAAYVEVKKIILEPDIATKAEAVSIAEAVLARIKSETLSGRIILPYHDCSVELFDRVQLQDNRGI
jgi:hypothetical protein